MKKNNRNKLVPVLDSLESRELLATSPIAVPAVASAQIQMASATKLKRFSETIYVDNALIGSSKTVDLKVRDFKGEGQFRRLLVSDLHGKLDKWNTKLGQWQNVRPLTLGQAARLPEAVLYRHTLGLQDKLRWTPGFTVSPFIWGKNDAFRVTGIGKAGALVTTPGVPAAVQDLTVKPIGVGKVALEWSPSDGASSYTVKVNGTENLIVKNVTWTVFENLSPTITYTFTVVPNNAAGSGGETKVKFGKGLVNLDNSGQYPVVDMTAGSDGSIWAGGKVLDKPNGSYIGGWAQQVKNLNGIWTPQDRVLLGQDAYIDGPVNWPSRLPSRYGKRMTTGLDGSIWFLCEVSRIWGGEGHEEQGAVMRMVQENGTWAPKEIVLVEQYPISVTTAIDGSIWVVSNSGNIYFGFDPGSVQRIVQGGDGNWFVDGDPIRIDIRPMDITAGLDGSIWVTSDPGPGSIQRIVEFPDGKWNVAGPALHVNDGRSDVSVWSLTTGIDGSIWVSSGQVAGLHGGHVQRIVNEHGEWFVKGSEIGVDNFAYLKPGHDGSIWALGSESKAAQHIVNERGTWFVKGDPIRLQEPQFFAAGSDGSMWYGNRDGTLEQIWTNPAAPTDLNAVADRTAGKATLSWKAPAADGGTPVLSYAVTARQGSIIQTDTNWGDTAYTFSGLDFSKGPVYFTVAATNFAGTSPVATLLIGQDGKTIDTTHLTTGITTDGTWVIGDGFDSLGHTYSWEALGSGAGLSNGKTTFNFGLPNQPQTIVAAGQEIVVPQGTYGSVNLAGAAVYYGAQPNLVFTLNYTDGTTEIWTQSISDWAKPQQYNGETTLVTVPYRNRGDGTRDSRSVYLYGYSRAIPQSKTLKSITLPQNQNVRILDIKMGN